MNNLHRWILISKSNRILMPVVICVVEVLKVIMGICCLSWDVVAFVVSPLFLLVFRCLLVTRSDAIHKVWITLMLSNLRLLLRVKVKIFSCFSHILWSLDSRYYSLMSSSLNCALSSWSWVRGNSKFAISYARSTSNTGYSCHFLWTCQLLIEPSWVHAYKRWRCWLIISIYPIIILDFVNILQNFSSAFVSFVIILGSLQSSLLLHNIVFILICISRLMIPMKSKTATYRIIDTASDRLVLMSVWFVLAMSHIRFCLLIIVLRSIFISWICNRSSHMRYASHIERALWLLMRRYWWFIHRWHMTYSWNLVISLRVDIYVCVVIIYHNNFSTISKLLSLHLLLSCENIIKCSKPLILIWHRALSLVRRWVLLDSRVLAT